MNSKYIYFFGALGGLLFGYDTGIISGALRFLDNGLHVVENSFTEGFVTASVLIGAAIGALVTGKLSDNIGRKKVLLFASVLFAIGALLSGMAPNAEFLIIARIILGLAVGSASALVPMYLSELAPAKHRGSLAFLNQLMIVLGILLAYVVNYFLYVLGNESWNIEWGWRVALGAALLPAIIMFIGTFALPESPRFLVRIGEIDEAEAVLRKLRTSSEVEREISEIRTSIVTKSGSLKELFSKFARPALIIGAGLAFFQQFMGINTVIYYAPKILETADIDGAGQRLITVGIGLMNVVATIIAITIVDKVNRRTLFTVGGLAMAILLGALAVLDFVNIEETNPTLSAISFSIILMLYIAAFGITWGGVMWIVLGEIFPLHVRGIGIGIASMINWVGNFAVTLLFPALLGHRAFMTDWGEWENPTMLQGHPFWLFVAMAVISVLGVLFVRVKLFETRGKSLEEIETEIQTKVLKG